MCCGQIPRFNLSNQKHWSVVGRQVAINNHQAFRFPFRTLIAVIVLPSSNVSEINLSLFPGAGLRRDIRSLKFIIFACCAKKLSLGFYISKKQARFKLITEWKKNILRGRCMLIASGVKLGPDKRMDGCFIEKRLNPLATFVLALSTGSNAECRFYPNKTKSFLSDWKNNKWRPLRHRKKNKKILLINRISIKGSERLPGLCTELWTRKKKDPKWCHKDVCVSRVFFLLFFPPIFFFVWI